eukprot:scaffold922_cov84-Cylindrotheca_fusiformis.AAC.1
MLRGAGDGLDTNTYGRNKNAAPSNNSVGTPIHQIGAQNGKLTTTNRISYVIFIPVRRVGSKLRLVTVVGNSTTQCRMSSKCRSYVTIHSNRRPLTL